MSPEMIAAVVTGGIGAFTGLSKALSNFTAKIDKKFERMEREIDALETDLMRNYVLKDDFVREMEAVHSKLDRILDYLIQN
jgi:hypothetical protein